MKLRKWISELMIYDADDESCSDEASEFLQSNKYGGWTVDAVGIRGKDELNDVLKGYVKINQITFCTHGFPGGVYFKRGSVTSGNVYSIDVPPDLFGGTGRLLFMGCETARSKAGEDFLVDAGRHFFAGKGGVVGGATIYALGFSSGARLPLLGSSSAGWHVGKLILFKLDTSGTVTGNSSVSPFGL